MLKILILTLFIWTITGSKTVQDYINEAKTQIASGNIPEAIQSYSSAIGNSTFYTVEVF